MEVKVKAYAKINLMLDIICTRPDGYHDLFMIMQSIGLYDTVTVTETNSKKITITCNIQDIPLDEKNIAYKAADAFFKTTKIKNKGVNIDIVKRIPHQAGLAGGMLVTTAAVIALQLSQGRSADELSLLAAFFTVLGDNLALIAGQLPQNSLAAPDNIGTVCDTAAGDNTA